jgi:hypothetical protein
MKFSIIILIPKEHETNTMRKFRPQSLGNCVLIFFTKATTNKINHISDRLIPPNQADFIGGRFSLQSVVSAHEVLPLVQNSLVVARRNRHC